MIRLALREVRRRPRRFAGAGGVLTLVMVLLVFLGGLLDGLFLGSTGAIRVQRADVLTYSENARDQFLRSRIDPALRARVEAAPGVREAGGLGVTLVGARIPGRDQRADAAVIGYELAPDGVPPTPPPGWGWADRRLRAAGAREGQTLRLGPRGVPVRVRGFVSDTGYLLQGGLWVAPATWRAVQNASLVDGAVGPGVFQVLAVRGAGDPRSLAAAIDAATGGQTSSLTREQAVFSLPGTRQQNRTFTGLIAATVVVAILVVALFFVLLTLERTALYGVLKAVGASSGQLFAGVVVQALVIALVAAGLGGAVALGLAGLMPAQVPVRIEPARVGWSAVLLLVAAALGSAMSLRRVIRVDPAQAIGRAG
ncbi:MAG TPA: ABC transporter permease [Miltoncostaeaceae bacterium]|nr:ABC transporter permease [Miltoncostaeaceae bacterium]